MLEPVDLKKLLKQIASKQDNSIGGDAIRRHDLEWTQYTGLKDGKGREIYEGDIVNRYGGGLLGDPKKIISSGPVVYVAPGFCIRGGGHIFNEGELEVVGNIYENPELVKEDHV